jgi:cell division protein ZapA (FtsZ GTPase activity inhibitor)
MQVSEITVSAGRTFNHPFESYSNLRPEVTIRATLAEGEDFEAVTKQLQAKAERLVEDHKSALLTSLNLLYEYDQAQRRITDLERSINHAQAELESLRSKAFDMTMEMEEA